MAQTKAKAKKRSTPKRAKSTASKSTAKPASKAKSKAKAKSSKAKSTVKPANRKAPSSSNGASHSNGSSSKHSNVDAVKHAVGRAKVPLVAGGAALAGAAGGLALAASKKSHKSSLGKGLGKAVARRPKIKVDSKDVAKAAKGVSHVSAQVSEIAGGLETAASGKDGRHRSPVEVVLQGLTARR